jgi:hypothetical protein
MNPQVGAHLACQQGLVLRRQAIAAGVSSEEIQRLLRHGEWIAVRRGVYTTRPIWESLDVRRGRAVLEARAASLNMVMPHVMSHDSAAYLLGLPILEARPRLVHITRFGHIGHRTKFGVKHHQAPFTPDQIAFVDDLPVLDRARTVADIAREHGLRHGLVAADAALRAGEPRSSLEQAYESMRNWRGVTIARESVALARSGAESAGESLGRLLLEQLGVGPVETQFGLTDGVRTAWCDLRIGRHIVEFDGRVKYQREQDGGFATAPPEEIVWREKQRQDWVCGFKLGMSRLTWSDVMPDQWAATQQRLLREIRDTNARFGTSIEDLAPYVVRRVG